MSLRVVATGPLATLQDRGRFAHLREGVSPAGPADPYAHAAALALAGCATDACAIELVGLPFTFVCDDPRIVAVTGPDVALDAEGAVPGWTAAIVHPRREITVIGSVRTRFAYLAISGGIDVRPVLGSRATHLASGIGALARPLHAGDILPLGAARLERARAGRALPPPSYVGNVRVTAGPHEELFEPDAIEAFLTENFTVAVESNRVGTRIAGPRVSMKVPGDILSIGVSSGAIQVPRDGAPIVLLADRQTTGGYPVIANVARADIGRVAQSGPGDLLRFERVDRAGAVRLLERDAALLAVAR